MRASQARNRRVRQERPLQNPGAVLQKVAESNLRILCRHWGAPRAWTGPRERAPSPLVFACSMTDTGEPARDVKESGEEAGESRTAISEALQAGQIGPRSRRVGKPQAWRRP